MLGPCTAAAAAWEVVAAAEALEEADEVGVVPALVPILEAVLEAALDKVTPCKILSIFANLTERRRDAQLQDIIVDPWRERLLG